MPVGISVILSVLWLNQGKTKNATEKFTKKKLAIWAQKLWRQRNFSQCWLFTRFYIFLQISDNDDDDDDNYSMFFAEVFVYFSILLTVSWGFFFRSAHL